MKNEVKACKCENCDTLTLTEEVEETCAVYECGSCGEEFTRENSCDGDSHQCPSCMKYASKIADHHCPNCDAALDVSEEIDAEECDHCSYIQENFGDDQLCPNCNEPLGDVEDEPKDKSQLVDDEAEIVEEEDDRSRLSQHYTDGD